MLIRISRQKSGPGANLIQLLQLSYVILLNQGQNDSDCLLLGKSLLFLNSDLPPELDLLPFCDWWFKEIVKNGIAANTAQHSANDCIYYVCLKNDCPFLLMLLTEDHQ